MTSPLYLIVLCSWAAASLASSPGTVVQDPLLFSTGNSDYKIATSARPDANGQPEIETGDDFILTRSLGITGIKFQGLISPWIAGTLPTDQAVKAITSKIKTLIVEFYLVFPALSSETFPKRLTVNAPPFPTSKVAARENSPSDDEFKSGANVVFQVAILKKSATVPLSVLNANIKPKPNQKQPLKSFTGTAIEISAKFSPVAYKANSHWFAVPQVDCGSGCEFLWLSAPKPIIAGSGPGFPPNGTDLQTWIRNDPGLDPDWERLGTDVVGGTAFNAAFKLYGK